MCNIAKCNERIRKTERKSGISALISHFGDDIGVHCYGYFLNGVKSRVRLNSNFNNLEASSVLLRVRSSGNGLIHSLMPAGCGESETPSAEPRLG